MRITIGEKQSYVVHMVIILTFLSSIKFHFLYPFFLSVFFFSLSFFLRWNCLNLIRLLTSLVKNATVIISNHSNQNISLNVIFFWNVFIILLCLVAFILLRNLSKFNRLYDMWVCGYMAVGLCVRFNWFGQSMLDVSYVNHFDWLVWLINDWHFIVL